MDLRYVPTVTYADQNAVPFSSVRDAVTLKAPAPRAAPQPILPEPRPREHWLPASWWGKPVEVPSAYVIELENAICFGGDITRRNGAGHLHGQLLITQDGTLIDESYLVRADRRTLPLDLVKTEGDVARLRADPTSISIRRGTHVLLRGTFPGHFGHFLTEGLAHTWARRSDATYVVYEDVLQPWQRLVLDTLGINRVVHTRDSTRFERLIVASSGCTLHRYMAPELREVYSCVRDAFEPRSHRWIYLSRSAFTKRRKLINETEVEARFRDRGFEVVHPENMPIREQIRMAAGADVLAGSAGSNMYLGAFQQAGARRLILSPTSFTLPDDQLISLTVGTELSYVLCDPAASDGTQPRYTDYVAALDNVDAALDALDLR